MFYLSAVCTDHQVTIALPLAPKYLFAYLDSNRINRWDLLFLFDRKCKRSSYAFAARQGSAAERDQLADTFTVVERDILF